MSTKFYCIIDESEYVAYVPDPMIGDSLNLNLNSITKRTKGQHLIQYRPSDRQSNTSISLTFSYLTDKEANDLYGFLISSLGYLVDVTIHVASNSDSDEMTDITFSGFITSPFNKVVVAGRDRSKNIALEMEVIEWS